MEISELVKLFVDNGTTIAVIIYFCLRDWKFNNQLVELLTTIKDMVTKIDNKERND